MTVVSSTAGEIVVIGGGPSGVAAAVQLKRSGFAPLLFERDRIGGLLREAHLVENYPGFPDGVAGSGLADLIAAHCSSAAIEVAFEEVERLDRAEGAFSVRTSSRDVIAGTVVIASGTKPRLLEGVLISEAARKRVHYGLREFEGVRGATVAVIGGGDAAHDYALNLSRENEVIMLHRSVRRTSLPLLRRRCEASGRISYRSNTAVREISAGPRGVVLRCREAGGDVLVNADSVLVAIGRVPRLDFLGGGLVEKLDVLRIAGRLYFVGDVANGSLRQAAISAGDGVRAAMEIWKRHEGDRENGKG